MNKSSIIVLSILVSSIGAIGYGVSGLSKDFSSMDIPSDSLGRSSNPIDSFISYIDQMNEKQGEGNISLRDALEEFTNQTPVILDESKVSQWDGSGKSVPFSKEFKILDFKMATNKRPFITTVGFLTDDKELIQCYFPEEHLFEPLINSYSQIPLSFLARGHFLFSSKIEGIKITQIGKETTNISAACRLVGSSSVFQKAASQSQNYSFNNCLQELKETMTTLMISDVVSCFKKASK